ncbi:LacI family DNA-binding transcriptional regulator [Helicovermis profundi]|uniref:LacI family DNA-binding transcriptional regulator n=1 Tax=Helicovermis profundi TaxID=3065157 RepID=A0AAU9EN37_9FIRM|nr:LacI family DNA-binding transcriptional regulator [Clostridia bacterium S502]
MKVTIKDVAKKANVSPSTVSRVIANNPRISDKTKEKVHKTLKELHYRPNVIARSLVSNKTNILGLIIPNSNENLFKNPFFIDVLRGISIYAQKHGYHIMYTYSKNEKEEKEYIQEYIYSNLVDGIILLTALENDPIIKHLKKEDFPFAVIGRPENTDSILWVDNDNFKAMYELVNHLIAQGHKDIAFIGGPSEFMFSKDRLKGYKMALSAKGYIVNDDKIIHESGFDVNSGYRACKKIFKNFSPTAIVTTDDLLAFGANKFLKEENIKEVEITGFNNVPTYEFQSHSITSIDIDSEGLGYSVAKLLIAKLNNQEMINNHIIVETKLIDRTSK